MYNTTLNVNESEINTCVHTVLQRIHLFNALRGRATHKCVHVLEPTIPTTAPLAEVALQPPLTERLSKRWSPQKQLSPLHQSVGETSRPSPSLPIAGEKEGETTLQQATIATGHQQVSYLNPSRVAGRKDLSRGLPQFTAHVLRGRSRSTNGCLDLFNSVLGKQKKSAHNYR